MIKLCTNNVITIKTCFHFWCVFILGGVSFSTKPLPANKKKGIDCNCLWIQLNTIGNTPFIEILLKCHWDLGIFFDIQLVTFTASLFQQYNRLFNSHARCSIFYRSKNLLLPKDFNDRRGYKPEYFLTFPNSNKSFAACLWRNKE